MEKSATCFNRKINFRNGRWFIIDTVNNIVNEKALLDIDEFCAYLGIGKTKARELLKMPRNGFSLKIGSKWYVHKNRLDKLLLEKCDKY